MVYADLLILSKSLHCMQGVQLIMAMLLALLVVNLGLYSRLWLHGFLSRLVEVGFRRQRSEPVAKSISQEILVALHPIKHTKNRDPLPSLPFSFPNGQGNVEKFFHGRENSAKWEQAYGRIYRLWSGTSSEMYVQFCW